ncbi:hypothetical protein CC2G_006109 [Coprinopsis cinerea AmutBmut pab1-1]|nr:hypothetical protein CC2G_006109 [Coprinopsis cinerea AmutBmut pab1-1]
MWNREKSFSLSPFRTLRQADIHNPINSEYNSVNSVCLEASLAPLLERQRLLSRQGRQASAKLIDGAKSPALGRCAREGSACTARGAGKTRSRSDPVEDVTAFGDEQRKRSVPPLTSQMAKIWKLRCVLDGGYTFLSSLPFHGGYQDSYSGARFSDRAPSPSLRLSSFVTTRFCPKAHAHRSHPRLPHCVLDVLLGFPDLESRFLVPASFSSGCILMDHDVYFRSYSWVSQRSVSFIYVRLLDSALSHIARSTDDRCACTLQNFHYWRLTDPDSVRMTYSGFGLCSTKCNADPYSDRRLRMLGQSLSSSLRSTGVPGRATLGTVCPHSESALVVDGLSLVASATLRIDICFLVGYCGTNVKSYSRRLGTFIYVRILDRFLQRARGFRIQAWDAGYQQRSHWMVTESRQFSSLLGWMDETFHRSKASEPVPDLTSYGEFPITDADEYRKGARGEARSQLTEGFFTIPDSSIGTRLGLSVVTSTCMGVLTCYDNDFLDSETDRRSGGSSSIKAF